MSLEMKLKEIFREIITECVKEIPYPSHQIIVEDALLTREEAALYLHVHVNAVTRYVKRGQLTNRGLGKRYLFLKSDLLNFKN